MRKYLTRVNKESKLVCTASILKKRTKQNQESKRKIRVNCLKSQEERVFTHIVKDVEQQLEAW